MPRFRYRTSALTGPWRDSAREAMRDAAKAKQAVLDDAEPSGLRWIVPGSIEGMNGEPARASLKS